MPGYCNIVFDPGFSSLGEPLYPVIFFPLFEKNGLTEDAEDFDKKY